MSNIVRSYSAEITGDKPCSEENIHKAYFLFRKNFIDEPEEIVLSSLAYMNYHQTAKFRSYELETIMGMKVIHDSNIGDGEWSVRKTDRKVYALDEVEHE